MSFNRFRVFFSMRYFYAEIDYFIHNAKANFYITKANLKKVISNAYEVLACFILRRINLNKIDKNGNTALHRALNSLDKKTAARLIKCGADVHAVNRNGDTPLHSIVRWTMPDIVALLIEHGADVNAVDKNGYTPLHRGVLKSVGRYESFFMKEIQHKKFFLLIEHGANVNTVNKDGDTPLFSAAKKGNPNIVALLLKHGANVDAVDKNGCTPLYRAVLGSKYEYVYEWGRYSFFDSRNTDGLDFFNCDKSEMLDLLMEHETNVNAVDNHGYTLLHNLVILNNLQAVAALIKYGPNVNTVGKKGITPLFSAVEKGNREIVALLIKHGADVNTVGKKGIMPLFSAVEKGNREIVALLIENGANVNPVNKDGITPLFNAIRNDNPEIVVSLLEHGADVNTVDKYGSTPLFGKGNPETVALLLKHGADINVVNENGVTPLMSAVSRYSWYGGEQRKMSLLIVRLLMLATLLDNVNVKKPDFVDRNQSISTLWSDCKVEIEAFLSKVMFNCTSLGALSFLDLCKEKDENKLAPLSQNEEVKNIFENVNRNTEKYPYFVEKIQAQFQKGLARNQALSTACNSIFTFNTDRQLNEDCWREILEYLPQEDLKNVTRIASLFFKQSPSNDSSNFSTAIKRNLMEAQRERDKADSEAKLKELEARFETKLNKLFAHSTHRRIQELGQSINELEQSFKELDKKRTEDTKKFWEGMYAQREQDKVETDQKLKEVEAEIRTFLKDKLEKGIEKGKNSDDTYVNEEATSISDSAEETINRLSF